MIGKKKKKKDISEISSNLNLITKHQIKHNDDDLQSKFIFYGDDKKFSHQLEICAVYQHKKSLKVLVLVDEESTIDFLRLKISEGFETLPEFSKLCGLTATNLHKIPQQGEEIQCPTEGIIQDNFINGDIIYCNLVTQEYWINVIFRLSNKYFTKMMKIDYKISVSQPFKALKLLLLKCGVNFYIERLRNDQLFKHFNFMVKNVQFVLNNDTQRINYNDIEKDEENIKRLFTFEGKVKCYITFELFEEMIFKNLRQNQKKHNIHQTLKLAEFEDMDFKEFIEKAGFSLEKKAIQSLAKEQIPFFKNDLYIYSFSKDINYIFDNIQDEEDNDDYIINKYKEQIVFFMPLDEINNIKQVSQHSSKKLSQFMLKKKSDDKLSYLMETKENPTKGIVKNTNFCYSFLESAIMVSESPTNDYVICRRNSTQISNFLDENDFEGESSSLNNNNKKSFLINKLTPTYGDFAMELTNLFDQDTFNEELKNNAYKIKLIPGIIESLSIPEFRDFLKINKDSMNNYDEYDILSQEQPVANINNLKILAFVILALLYYIGIVVIICFDYIKFI